MHEEVPQYIINKRTLRGEYKLFFLNVLDTVQNVSINEIFTAPKFTNDLNAYKKVAKSEGSSLKLKCDSEGTFKSLLIYSKQ